MRNIISRLVPLTLVSLFSFGCTSLPPVNFSAPNIGVSSIKIDAELKSITVTVARPEEATGDIDPGIGVHTGLWKTALEEAFNKMAIFKDDSLRKVSLVVKIIKFEVPGWGAKMTTSVSARYEIIDRSNGSIIFTTDVSASGVVPGDYAFVGKVRALESINRSVQNNIVQFLQVLETVDIDKPMFPSS
jgi:hypothetical protein